jgi:integrase
MPLTDPACKNAACPQDKPRLRLADSGGLYLEVTPTGSKLWRWKYRFLGKEKRLALGAYPDVSLKQARLDRDTARRQLAEGLDPGEARREVKAAKVAAAVAAGDLSQSFETIARQWHARWSPPRSPRHADYVLRRLEADVFPVIGKRHIASIQGPDIVDLARQIEKRGAQDIARRAWQTCGQVFRYAITLKGPDGKPVLTRNPAKELSPSDALMDRKKEHFARVDTKELPELLRKIHGYQGQPFTRFAMQLMALTFVRTGELIGARWEEVDLDAAEWRIPAARMKMRTPHIVPLSTQAVDVLRCLHEMKGISGLVFPGERDHEKPMSNGTILAALRRMGYAGRMTGHGFRSIASTVLHEQGFNHMHIELQLAHQERDAVSAAYNHATYLPQRREMLQWWADHLDALRRGAKVLPFAARAAA